MPNTEQTQDDLNPSQDESPETTDLDLVDEEDEPAESVESVPEPQAEEQADVDYKAMFEAEVEKLKTMTSVNRKLGGALREARKKGVQEQDKQPAETDSPDQEPASEYERFFKERIGDDVEDLLDDMLENEDERRVVKLYYQQRIVPTGYSRRAIREDLENARMLVNKGRLAKKREETVKRGTAQKAAMGAASVSRSTAPPSDTKAQPTITKREYALLKRFGMKDADIRKKFSS